MTTHKTETRAQWLAARLKLLKAEKDFTRKGDELARKRRDLPWVRVDKDYRFETEEGSATLKDLFRGRSQLLVYHFMFGPDYNAGCPACSAIADGFNGVTAHLANHDVMLWAVSRAPLPQLEAYKRRMGWNFPWASSYGGDFNPDFNVWFSEEQQSEGGIEYNYEREPPMQLRQSDEPAIPSRTTPDGPIKGAAMCGVDVGTYTRERPGVSAFVLEDGVVYHTYSAYARGLDSLWGMYQWLDRAPKGRNETGMWWRRRDEYPPERSDGQAAAAPGFGASRDALVAICLAVLAAIAIKLPALFGIEPQTYTGFYARNFSLFVLPLLAGYFAWKRQLDTRTASWLAAAFIAAAIFANAYTFAPLGSTEILTALHLPIALWLVVGIAYAGGRWSDPAARMDFIRFSGEAFIYGVLIALGGGVLTALMGMIFKTVGIDIEPLLGSWLLPCGAAGAVIIAAWLADAKQGVMENMAPILARLFTPLFAAVLLVFLGTVLFTGRVLDLDRDLLIGFNLLLVVVLGLLLYSISARDPHASPGAFDVIQIVLVVSALVADAVVLWAMAARINEFGFTPNRVAALGENALLLVNLAWSAVLYTRFLRRQGQFTALERWQTDYLPVYAAWAALVVIAFPPLFGGI